MPEIEGTTLPDRRVVTTSRTQKIEASPDFSFNSTFLQNNERRLYLTINDQDIIEPNIVVTCGTVSLNISSSFEPLVDASKYNSSWLGALSNLANSATGLSISTQFPQMGFKIWKSSEPLTFTLDLEFKMGNNPELNSGSLEVYEPAMNLSKLTLPTKHGKNGNWGLVAPGPALSSVFFGHAGIGGNNYELQIGNWLYFKSVLIESGTPSFGEEFDSDGFPTSATLSLNISTVEIAYQELIDSITINDMTRIRMMKKTGIFSNNANMIKAEDFKTYTDKKAELEKAEQEANQ